MEFQKNLQCINIGWKVDQQVLSFLHSTISEAIIPVISKSISSKDVWTALENHFNSKNASRIMDLQRQFYNFSKGNSTTDDYVKSFKAIVKSLAAVGQPVSEAAMIFAFLRGLGTDYEKFVMSTNANIGHLRFEDVITNLKGHDAYLAYQRSLPSSLSSFPPMANSSQLNNSSVKDQPRNSNGNSTRNYWYINPGHGRGRQNRYPPRCQICSLFGHRARNAESLSPGCPKMLMEIRTQWLLCRPILLLLMASILFQWHHITLQVGIQIAVLLII